MVHVCMINVVVFFFVLLKQCKLMVMVKMSHQVFMTYQFGLKSERAFRDLEAFYDPETKTRK